MVPRSFFDFLWNVNLEQKIAKVAKVAKVANSVTDKMQQVWHLGVDVHFLRATVERLALTNASLVGILSERVRVTERDILEKIEEIDLRDGVKDWKITLKPRNCSKCSKDLSEMYLAK